MTGARPGPRAARSGSAIIAVLAILAVTLAIVGAALSEARHRFRTSHQSSRWAQAEHAAEAGAELALMSAQKASWITDGWPAAPGAPGTAAVAKTFDLSTGVPATGPVNATVSVDQVALGGANWLRIRSTGKADVSGGAVAGMDPQDVLLRKLSLRQDRSDGTSVGAAPRATRMVEILAEPSSKSIFQMPLLLDKKFTMSGGWVDSFDSGDPTKSTGGLYDIAKRQSNGNVAINDTQGASNLGGAYVYGDLDYGGAPPTNTSNVQGAITGAYSNPVNAVTAPAWTTFNATPTDIQATTTLTGGTQAAPARYKVQTVTLSAGKVLNLVPHAPGAESYIEIWATSGMTTSGSGYIDQQSGVHVTYYIEGDITVSGSSFNNRDNIAANNVIHAVNPPVGTTQKVTVSGSGTFIGAIDGPGADFTISGGANLSGAVIGKTMSISGGGSVHYDEALRRAGGGGSGAYRVKSWVEAVR